MKVPQLTKEAARQRAVAARAETAAARLDAKCEQLLARGARARKESNEREAAAAIASRLRADATLLRTDARLVGELDRTGMLSAGWRPLTVAISRLRQQEGETRFRIGGRDG